MRSCWSNMSGVQEAFIRLAAPSCKSLGLAAMDAEFWANSSGLG